MWRKNLWQSITDLDRLLRGEATRPDRLFDGDIQIPLGGLAIVLVLLGLVYGVCMGTYALFRGTEYGPQISQFAATTIKVPALFVLTLAVTLPSLYVFNALVGSRLTIGALLRLFVAALGVGMAVLASLGPIVAVFSINTTTYSFIVLLNVLIFAFSGFLSLGFLLQTLHRISIAPYWTAATETRPITPPQETATVDEGIPPLPIEGQVSEALKSLSEPAHVEPEGPL